MAMGLPGLSVRTDFQEDTMIKCENALMKQPVQTDGHPSSGFTNNLK
jgi:hypothetical protein